MITTDNVEEAQRRALLNPREAQALAHRDVAHELTGSSKRLEAATAKRLAAEQAEREEIERERRIGLQYFAFRDDARKLISRRERFEAYVPALHAQHQAEREAIRHGHHVGLEIPSQMIQVVCGWAAMPIVEQFVAEELALLDQQAKEMQARFTAFLDEHKIRGERDVFALARRPDPQRSAVEVTDRFT